MVWDWKYALDILPGLLEVAPVTILATLGAFAVALILGLGLAFARRSTNRLLSGVTHAVVEFIRSTPPFVQLFFLFFVMPQFGVTMSALMTGILGLGIHYSTFLSEVYRAGIDSVEKGQWEAATALNFTPRQKWMRIILPQAIRPIIPVMGNYLITLFKETPMLLGITVVEMLSQAQIIGSQSFRYTEPVTLVGIFFLVLSYGASLLVKRLEIRLNVHR
ncbi:amino acid ABC transporter membrane protein 2, PAAT family [Marininema mesophilum]|uniref:Amino acid ABC transporter membrane protein 2, PAAT family n=1 Tax=Marininema mesophilum TaxID=1048340 RepID=A0A1H2V9A8_9BACL|nr:ectoine/hydroxyectoine ABC transporter permease subunit EhuD [Marininema mesophilum]SDW64893.1 amino acid ABC transporter membrane protein 2, PAAT family [Marininema mesophilum]